MSARSCSAGSCCRPIGKRRASPPRPTPERFTAGADAGGRLDTLVATRLGLSRTQAATLIANGKVLVNGKRERAAYRALADDVVQVTLPEAAPERTVQGEDIPVTVVFEDDDLLVVDKSAGMVVHPAPGNWTGTLVNALVGRGQHLAEGGGAERAGLVHRLDKETSGLLVVAKSEVAHRRLSAAIAQRRVTREYVAMVWGHLEGDALTVDQPLARDPRDRKRMAVVNTGKVARTDFRRLARFRSADLLRAHLHSGRTHQIRVHMAFVGHPVVGDDVYGGGGGRRLAELPPKRHFLHAAWLRFHHPVSGVPLDFRSPLPDDLRRSLAAIAEDERLLDDPDPLATFGFYDTSASSNIAVGNAAGNAAGSAATDVSRGDRRQP